MNRLARLFGAAVLACCLACSAASAAGLRLVQTGGAQYPERAFLLSLSTPVKLTPAQVSVTENGVPVGGLSVKPPAAAGVSHAGTVLLIDTSLSMRGAAIQDAIQAAASFISARNPSQPMGIAYFDKTVNVVAPMTTNTSTLNKAIARLPTLHFGTDMFDAGSSALQILARAKLAGGSIVLLSNRGDNGSSVSQPALEKTALSQGVRIYTVGLRYPTVFPGHTLQSLAADTHGFYTLAVPSGLATVYRGLGALVSNQYQIRYRSVASLGRAVKVAVSVPGYGPAFAGYAAPSLPSVPPVGSTPAKKQPASFWTSTAGALIASAICALLIGIAIMLVIRRREGVRERIGTFVTSAEAVKPSKQRSLAQRALGDPRERRIERSGRWAVLQHELDIAEIPVSAGRFAALTVAAAIVFGWLLVTATSSALAAVVAVALPVAVRFGVSWKANRQRREFEEQIPDNLQVVASALRAGHTFIGSLGVVLEDAPEPSRRELRRALADQQLGIPLADALNQVSDRMHSSDFRHVALIATLQQNAGGNSAEVIDLVTETIRDRLDLRRLVRTLTAQGRLAGGILSALPVALLAAISFINPDYIHPLFHKPLGVAALVLAGIMVISGALIIKRIVDIEI
jgi:tight adherence protein B